jgi:hypothetical protein
MTDNATPLCKCHGEPMLWKKNKELRAGGRWTCRVKQREAARQRRHAKGDHIRALKRARYPHIREQRLACNREYYARNSEKLLAKDHARYWKNREAILAQKRQYRIENREAIAAYQREYYAAHREERSAYLRDYYAANASWLNLNDSLRVRVGY